MKLLSAVKMGRLCGLQTVEEAIFNVELHAIQLYPYKEVAKELEELYTEYELYKKGEITFDFVAIDKENDEELAEFFDNQVEMTSEEKIQLDNFGKT